VKWSILWSILWIILPGRRRNGPARQDGLGLAPGLCRSTRRCRRTGVLQDSWYDHFWLDYDYFWLDLITCDSLSETDHSWILTPGFTPGLTARVSAQIQISSTSSRISSHAKCIRSISISVTFFLISRLYLSAKTNPISEYQSEAR
jgi:hypothetical protein